jgi:hypothetical protein
MHIASGSEIERMARMDNLRTKGTRNRRLSPANGGYLLSGFDTEAAYAGRTPTWTPAATSQTVADAIKDAESWLATQTDEACVEVISRRAEGMTVIRVVTTVGVEDVTPNAS